MNDNSTKKENEIALENKPRITNQLFLTILTILTYIILWINIINMWQNKNGFIWIFFVPIVILFIVILIKPKRIISIWYRKELGSKFKYRAVALIINIAYIVVGYLIAFGFICIGK